MTEKKKANLAAALAEQSAPEPVSEPQAPPAGPANDRRSRRKADERPGRAGQTTIAGWFPIAVKFQLDELRLKLSRDRGLKVTLQDMQAEAYNDLFKKYGLAEIAPGPKE